MSLNKNVFGIVLMTIVLLNCKDASKSEHTRINKYVIEVEELVEIIHSDSVTILDLRKPDQFITNHIPNSINIWRNELQSDSFPYQGMLGEKHLLESVFGSKGIATGQFLVMYDDNGSCEATRLWWMLHYYGYEKMAILNGGISAWQGVDSLTMKVSHSTKCTFKLPNINRSETLINVEDLFNLKDSLTLIDTRTKSEFTGEILKQGAILKGRIPGSNHIDWMNTVDPVTNKFRSISELDSIYKGVVDSENSRVVTYCHSGVRSSHTFFILSELLGYKDVRNFDGSWVEWTYHNLPVEVDTELIQ
ncbi:MAG: rhodanese-like domain-containing protein [Ekhidna sp.]